MTNATTLDACAGYMIYRRALGAPTLDEVNAILAGEGYAAVSQRTLAHYRKLYKAGIVDYIPINRYDVATASRPYDNS